MNLLLQRLITHFKQIGVPSPVVTMQPIAPIEAQCLQFSEQFLAQLWRNLASQSSDIDIHHKGVEQNFANLRSCIKNTSTDWVKIIHCPKIDEDKRQFLHGIQQQLNERRQLQPKLTKHTHCCMQCCLVDHCESIELASENQWLSANHSIRLSALIALKRQYINCITESMKEVLCQGHHLKDTDINSQLVALIQDASEQYLHNTFLVLTPDHRAYIQQCILDLEKHQNTFGNATSAQGTYELAVLAQAKSWLAVQLQGNAPK